MSKVIKRQQSPQVEVNSYSYGAPSGPGLEAHPFFAEAMDVSDPNMSKRGSSSPMETTAQLETQRKAYEEGFVQGERNGLRMGEEKLKTIFIKFEELFTEIATLKEKLFKEAEQDILLLSIEIAKKVVRKAVRFDEEILQTLIRITLSKVARHSKVKIYLNPTDHQALTRSGELIERHRSEFDSLELISDEKIEQGGCLLETSSGILDARLSEQFKEIEKEFLDLMPKF